MNCLKCKNFASCKDPSKSGSFSCSSFSAFVSAGSDFDPMALFGIAKSDDNAIDELASDLWGSKTKDYDSLEDQLADSIEEALASNSPVPRDTKIDDRDMKEYSNFYEWCFDKNGLGINPFARQLWLGLKLFGEICPRASCSNQDWVHDVHSIPVDFNSVNMPDYVTIMNNGVCPKCHGRKSEMVASAEMNFYSELAFVAGQRSGKSKTIAFLVSYHLHKMLKSQNPLMLYNLSKGERLTYSFVALTFGGAMELLWRPISDLIDASPWFQEYHKMLNHYSKQYGAEFYKQMDTFLTYNHRSLNLSPSGPNKRTLRGRTRAISSIDELGWFAAGAENQDKVLISGTEIYAALSNSMTTVRVAAHAVLATGVDNIQQGLMMNVSSPSSINDTLMTLVRANETSRDVLTLHLPTWQYNPHVPRASLEMYYRNNPINAERDFGANPPMSASPFIADEELVESLFTGRKNPIQLDYIQRTNKMGKVERGATLRKATSLPSQMPPTVMSIDAGLVNNSFSVTVQSVDWVNGKPKITCHCWLEIIPGPAMMLNYNQIYKNVIVPVAQLLNTKALFADQWNSAMLLSSAEADLKIIAQRYSPRYGDFIAFRSYLTPERYVLPRMESGLTKAKDFSLDKYPYCFEDRPGDHLAVQLLTVQDNRKLVSKGPGMTDDTFRALVLGSKFLLDEDWCKANLGSGKRRTGHGGGLCAVGNTSTGYGGGLVIGANGAALGSIGNASGYHR